MSAMTRGLLWGVLGTLVLTALAGIGVVVSGSRANSKVMLALLSVGFFGLAALGVSVVAENSQGQGGLGERMWRWAMGLAWGVCGVGLVLFLGVIYFEPEYEWHAERWVGAVAVWTVALPHGGLLGLTRFKGAMRWVRWGAIGVVYTLAAYLSLMIADVIDEEWWWRVGAVLGILAGLGTIGLPVLHRLYGVAPAVETTKTEVEAKCPRCSGAVVLMEGKSACGGCGLKFELKVEEPRCAGCGYLLYRLEAARCPECGRDVVAA